MDGEGYSRWGYICYLGRYVLGLWMPTLLNKAFNKV